MTLAIRFIPNAGRAVMSAASGRTYRVTGTTVNIPFPDADTIHADQATKLMVVGNGRHTAGLAGLPVCGRRTRRSMRITVTTSSAPSVPSSLSGQWQRTRADLRLSTRAIGSPDTTEIRLAASI
jgi:hypothetical protein